MPFSLQSPEPIPADTSSTTFIHNDNRTTNHYNIFPERHPTADIIDAASRLVLGAAAAFVAVGSFFFSQHRLSTQTAADTILQAVRTITQINN